VPQTPRPRPLPRLRNQLLGAIALTNLGAVAGIMLAMWLTETMQQPARGALLATLFLLVATVWISVLRRRIAELAEAPLAHTIAAAEAIAAGDTTRRTEPGETLEFDALSTSINRMTGQLLEADKMRMRVEKLVTMGRLAAGISHEIGNPLAALANYVHVVRMRTGRTPDTAEPLDAMEREIARMDRIMRGLLDYSRPRRMTPKPVIIDEVIDEVVRLLGDQGVLRRIELRTELAAADAAIYAERHDLAQVFVNLLLNAVDAIDTSGTIVINTRTAPTASITATNRTRQGDAPHEQWAQRPGGRALAWLGRSDRADRLLQVVVADSGTGVAPEDEERIFEPFFSTKVPGKGTGLGLAIVARTVENMGGTIWVQRAREGGAAFIMLFPLHQSLQAGLAAISARNS
jgi:two-component system, NtrC family, sensor kinase